MAETESNGVPETETAEEQLADQAAEVAEEQAAEPEEGEKEPLSLEVKIDKSGTCERHVTVAVSRQDIDRYMEREFDELAPEAQVPGFRPGRAPRKLVVNRFKDQVGEQVKGKLLVDSITQLSETDEFDFSPISEPDLDLTAVKIPDDGPMTFEFDVEVRPEFDLPQWKGLDLEEPVYEITDEDIDRHLEKILTRYAKLEQKDGPAEAGDYVTLNMTFTRDGDELSSVGGQTVPVKRKLSFADAELENFDELITGAKPGETRETNIKISEEGESEGGDVHATFEVVKVESVKLPKLSPSFLSEIGDFTDENDLRNEVRKELERQRRFRCQQHLRRQITQQLTAGANWELPKELLRKQAQRESRRMVLELEAAGFSKEVIQAHANQLQRNSLAHTATALKEHFILERIADEEKVEVQEPEDYDVEIEQIAEQEGIPPRRVRARLEKRGEMDALRNQIVERKVIEKIKSFANVREVPFKPVADDVTAVDHMISGARVGAEIPEAKHADGGRPLPGQPERG